MYWTVKMNLINSLSPKLNPATDFPYVTFSVFFFITQSHSTSDCWKFFCMVNKWGLQAWISSKWTLCICNTGHYHCAEHSVELFTSRRAKQKICNSRKSVITISASFNTATQNAKRCQSWMLEQTNRQHTFCMLPSVCMTGT